MASRTAISRRAGTAARSAGHHASTPAVVIEFGSSQVRIGFSGESAPRHVVPTPDDLYLPSAGRPSPLGSNLLSARRIPHDETGWEKVLYPFLSNVLTDLLLLKSVRSRRVVVLEPFVSPTTFRTALCRVLLVRLGVASVMFVPGSAGVIASYGLGLGDGVVVDVGRWEGRVAIVGGGDGSVLVDTFQAVPCGFESLVQTFLTAHNNSCPASCAIPTLDDGRSIVLSCLDADSSANGQQQLMIPSSSRLISVDARLVQSCINELFFDPSNPESLVHAFLSALLACPIDIRKSVVRNVVLVGGTVDLLPNFERRFLKSVKEAMEPRSDDGDAAGGVGTARFRPLRRVVTESGPLGIVHPIPFAPRIVAWTSASVMGTLELGDENWVRRESFEEQDEERKELEVRGRGSSGMLYDFLSS